MVYYSSDAVTTVRSAASARTPRIATGPLRGDAPHARDHGAQFTKFRCWYCALHGIGWTIRTIRTVRTASPRSAERRQITLSATRGTRDHIPRGRRRRAHPALLLHAARNPQRRYRTSHSFHEFRGVSKQFSKPSRSSRRRAPILSPPATMTWPTPSRSFPTSASSRSRRVARVHREMLEKG